MLFFLGEELLSICILEKDCLNVYTEDGEDYFVKLPFPVSIFFQKFDLVVKNVPDF